MSHCLASDAAESFPPSLFFTASYCTELYLQKILPCFKNSYNSEERQETKRE